MKRSILQKSESKFMPKKFYEIKHRCKKFYNVDTRSGSPWRSFHVAIDASFDGKIDVDTDFKMAFLLA